MSPDPVAALGAKTGTRTQARARAARNRRLLVHGNRVLLLVLVVAFWEVLARAEVIDPFNFSMPSAIWDQIREWALHGTAQGSLWEQIWYTLYEALLGWVLGSRRVSCSASRWAGSASSPTCSARTSRCSTPSRASCSRRSSSSGSASVASKVASAVVLVFFPVFFNAFQGAREVDRNLVNNARILGASNRRVTLQVVIPSATSWIFTSLHVSFGFALIGAIVGEYIGATKGLGLLVAASQGRSTPPGCTRRWPSSRSSRCSPRGCSPSPNGGCSAGARPSRAPSADRTEGGPVRRRPARADQPER